MFFIASNSAFAADGAYNSTTTVQPIICQITKNTHSISTVLKVTYEAAGNGTTVSMTNAARHTLAAAAAATGIPTSRDGDSPVMSLHS